MIHSSWVWVAWVDRARSGSATLSDAMAAVTAPSATQTTAVTAVVLTAEGLPRREPPGRNLVARKASSPATKAMMIMTASGLKEKEYSLCIQGDHAVAATVNKESSFFLATWLAPGRTERAPARQACAAGTAQTMPSLKPA